MTHPKTQAQRSATTAVGSGLLIALVVVLVGAGAFTQAAQGRGAAGTYPEVSIIGGQVVIDRGDGQGPTVLTQGWEAKLSPDRQQVAFTREPADLWVVGSNGQSERLVLSLQQYNEYRGVQGSRGLYLGEWAPDGATIVCSYCTGNSVCDLMAVGPDGGNLRRLAPTGHAMGAWPSIFSPDGRLLMLGKNIDASPALGVLDLTDLTVIRLSQRGASGSWSPDGSRVAFTWFWEEMGFGLEVVSVDGATRVDVAALVRAATGRPFEPYGLVTWSGEGTEIAVQDHRDNHYHAFRLDGTGFRPVASLFEPYPNAPATTVASTSWGQVKEQAR